MTGLRWTACLLAAVAAVGAVNWSDDSQSSVQPEPASLAPSRDAPGAGPAEGTSERTTTAPIANPFSTFQQEPRREGVPVSPPTPPAPALPFVYAGTRIEGGRAVVLLTQPGRVVAVSAPGMLDAMYEVESIDEREVVLVYLPLMTRQVLALPATRAVAAAAPAAPSADSTESDTESGN